MNTTDLSSRFAAWWESLPEARRLALAADLAKGVEEDGLTVFRADEARFHPIPTVLSPQPIAEKTLAALSADARLLLTATTKVATWTLSERGRRVGRRLYVSFTPLEWQCLADPARLQQVATARVDTFLDPAGTPRVLEMNATIPAMQGYSDILAHRWIRLVSRERGLGHETAEQLVAQAGSNTADLLVSLVAHFHKAGGKADRPSILIVSRRGDAQLGELKHYERAFAAAGHRALHVFVDEIALDHEGHVRARGERFDLVYRHVFARRVDPTSALARLFVNPGPNVVLNPVVSPLEVKGVLALLSRAASDHALSDECGLSMEELDAVRRTVPWTRVLSAEPAVLPDGSRVPDLAKWTSEHPSGLVIKRSWDYGGKGVVLGPDAPGWRGAVAQAVAETDPWVVQELVPPRPVRHLLLRRDSGGGVVPGWQELFVDVSAYANQGVDVYPRGGVCRASGSKIVNILGGGGLTPLISTAVLEALLP
ncbi:MAG: hypothetical protein HY698_12875 [Deltaproteobacteria bacterium]|nr:hypothetical protein [Deltaproteobacteria bacterium]